MNLDYVTAHNKDLAEQTHSAVPHDIQLIV